MDYPQLGAWLADQNQQANTLLALVCWIALGLALYCLIRKIRPALADRIVANLPVLYCVLASVLMLVTR